MDQRCALEDQARQQLLNVAQLPFIFKWVAAMPDVHWGIGATVGSVIPTKGAIIPAAVGVDIGCGMMAVQTDLNARDLPENLKGIRAAIEKAVPHGRTNHGGRGDRGAWSDIPARNMEVWAELKPRYDAILAKHSKLDRGNHANHLGTLGTGNHFIEVCLDEADAVWFMLHSGSRGVGNRMGSYFIDLARKDMERLFITLPDRDLAYFPERSEHFDDYVEAVEWAQDFARWNRHLMMEQIVARRARFGRGPPVRGRAEGDQLPPQLRGSRIALRRKHSGHAQGRGSRTRGRYGNHSRQHGSAFLHRARQGQSGELSELQPRRGSCHVAHGSKAAFLGRGSRAHDGGHRMPQGCGRD